VYYLEEHSVKSNSDFTVENYTTRGIPHPAAAGFGMTVVIMGKGEEAAIRI